MPLGAARACALDCGGGHGLLWARVRLARQAAGAAGARDRRTARARGSWGGVAWWTEHRWAVDRSARRTRSRGLRSLSRRPQSHRGSTRRCDAQRSPHPRRALDEAIGARGGLSAGARTATLHTPRHRAHARGLLSIASPRHTGLTGRHRAHASVPVASPRQVRTRRRPRGDGHASARAGGGARSVLSVPDRSQDGLGGWHAA